MSASHPDDMLRELLALSAVDALDPVEQAEVERLVAERPDLAAELEELRGAAVTMADAVSEPPPQHLRGAVLAAIAGEAQRLPVDAAGPRPGEPPTTSPASPVPTTSAGSTLPTTSAGSPDLTTSAGSALPTTSAGSPDLTTSAGSPVPTTGGTVVPLRPGRRRRGGWMLGVTSAAAAAVLVVTAAVLSRRDEDGPPGDPIAAVLEDPEHVVMPFVGEVRGITMVYSPEHRDAVIVADDIAPPEGTQVYELWRFERDQPVRVGIFRPDEGGTVRVLMTDMDITATDAFAITVEPAGGTDAPTGPVVAQTA